MDYIVSVKGVSKSYGEVQALKDVCFEVKPGEIFGLIGPDGAGKTTLFRILTTLVLADEGKAEVCGQDVVKNYKEIRRQAGYMPVFERFYLLVDTLYQCVVLPDSGIEKRGKESEILFYGQILV